MAWIAVVAVVVSLMAGGGMVYAADAAAPGDALYSLDRSIEDLRLDLTTDPQAAFELQLALASERLEEAEKVLGKAKTDQFKVALDNYDATVATIAETVRSSAAADQAVLGGLLDEAIASHDTLLADMVYDGRAGVMLQPRDFWCPEPEVISDTHPVGVTLAEKWDDFYPALTATDIYTDVMSWFCAGYGFGEINLAYRVSLETELTVAEVLDLRLDSGWGLILWDAGMIGPENQAGPFDVPPGLSGGEGPSTQGPQGSTDSQGPQGSQGSQGSQGPTDSPGGSGDGQQGPPTDTGSGNSGASDSAPQGPPSEQGQGSGQGNGGSSGGNGGSSGSNGGTSGKP